MSTAAPGAPPTTHRLAGPLATIAAGAAALAFVGAVDPNEPGHYPPCPVHALTGLYCPGCGGLRSAHALAHGDLAAAVGGNALAVAAFALVAYVLGVWLVAAARDRPARVPARVNGWVVLGLVVAFTVARNLPWGAALAP
jgi:Protein of unknown function (DUF2752)